MFSVVLFILENVVLILAHAGSVFHPENEQAMLINKNSLIRLSPVRNFGVCADLEIDIDGN